MSLSVNSNSDQDRYEDQSSESGSESSSESNSGSESDSSIKLAPVFISKAKRNKIIHSSSSIQQKPMLQKKEAVMKNIELNIQQDIAILKEQSEVTRDYEGIDDTDGLDPEGEFRDWENRVTFRLERDNERQLREQQEFEEKEANRT